MTPLLNIKLDAQLYINCKQKIQILEFTHWIFFQKVGNLFIDRSGHLANNL